MKPFVADRVLQEYRQPGVGEDQGGRLRNFEGGQQAFVILSCYHITNILKIHPDVAKDGNAPVGTRATAAKDAVSDKLNEQKHHTHANVEKNKPT